MRSVRKRSPGEDSSSSSSAKIATNKRHTRQYNGSSSALNYPIDSSYQLPGKRSNFKSYTEISSLPPKVKILCEILANTPSATVERVLEDTGIRVTQQDVEDVLQLSFNFPGAAVKFFRWSSFQLNDKHSTYAWNLVVDLLGKNCLFDAMWDAIKSMKKEMLLSLATFSTIFTSYAIANRPKEAIMSFEVMDQYDLPRDVIALNSLLSALCKEGKTREAIDYTGIAKNMFRLDVETYTILLKGCESEGDFGRAKQIFSDFIMDIGWDSRNTIAYDSFLCTLLTGPDGMHEVFKYLDTMRIRSCYPGMKFLKFAIDECARKSDAQGAKLVWEELVGQKICGPDTELYKSLMSCYCNVKEFDSAEKLLDEMVYNGAFPDSETYRLLFHFLIKHKRLRNAIPMFKEMVKNEFVPMQEDCSAAVKLFIDEKDPHMAIKVWRFMTESFSSDLEDTGNLLVLGLRDLNRVPEAVKCSEEMIELGIKLNSSTLTKLKQSLSKAGKPYAYEELLRKWKFH